MRLSSGDHVEGGQSPYGARGPEQGPSSCSSSHVSLVVACVKLEAAALWLWLPVPLCVKVAFSPVPVAPPAAQTEAKTATTTMLETLQRWIRQPERTQSQLTVFPVYINT